MTHYLTGNKATVAWRMMEDTGLDKKRPEITKAKTQEKIASMIKLYKIWRAKADNIGWGTDPDQHNDLTKGGIVTIKSIILNKCFFYYTFEEIIGTNSSVTSLQLSKSGHPNYVEDTSVLGDDAPDNPDINPEFYTNWVAKSHTSLKKQVNGLTRNKNNQSSPEVTKSQ